MRQYRPTSVCDVEHGDGLVALQARLHRHERIDAHAVVVGAWRSRSRRASRTRAARSGAIAATITAAAATRRAPRPAATSSRAARPGRRPHRPPALHAPEPVGEQQRGGRDEEEQPEDRADTSSSTESAKPTSATGGSSAEQRAPGAERERVRREHRGPHTGEPGEHQGGQRRRGSDLHPGLLADLAGGVERGAQRSRAWAGRTRSSRGTPASPIAIARPDGARRAWRARGCAVPAARRSRAEATPAASRRSVGPVALEDAAERDARPRRRPAPSRRRRSDAVCERTFPGCVPSFLQGGRGGQHDAVPSGAGEREVRLGGPALELGGAGRGQRPRVDRMHEHDELRPEAGARADQRRELARAPAARPRRRATCRPRPPVRRWASEGPTERAEACD